MTGNSGDMRDVAPGEAEADGGSVKRDVGVALLGLMLAGLLTARSFYLVGSNLVWAPSIPVALVVLAVAQMGVHPVYFLHLTSGPDNTKQRHGAGF
jgi:heme/copper-type cytochrome/quinol oxidase subunit 4